MSNEWMQELRLPFHPAMVSFKPGVVKGKRALALAYADLRAYMNRLDEVCGADWSVQYQPWGDDKIICNLTIAGVTRSSVGETTNEADRNEIGGMVAEAQAMKRACAMFGLGRYLYNLPTIWADFDPETKQFTQHAKAKLTGTLVQHYRRVTGINPGDGTADYEASRAAETPQTAQDSDKAPRRAQTPQRPPNGAQKPMATPDVSADEVYGNDDGAYGNDGPWYVIARGALQSDVAKIADTALGYHRDGGPASAPQYQYLSGLIDTIVKDATGADDGHKRVLAVLCQSEIGKDNPVSKTLASRLLDKLATHKKVDGVKVENDAYDQTVVDACVTIYRAAEAVATPQLFEVA